MASFVLYDGDYSRELAQGTLQLENFDHYFLCEGDSWMDRSSLSQLSLKPDGPPLKTYLL